MTYARNAALTIITFAIAGTAAALPASASSWAIWEGQNEATPRVIYTEAADEIGVLLACDHNGDMRALLTMEPNSIPEVLAKNAPYARGTSAVLTVGENAPYETKFRYTPATKALETRSHTVAAKVFNAAILGEAVKVETKREGTAEIKLPAPDAHFKSFAKTCKALRDDSTTS